MTLEGKPYEQVEDVVMEQLKNHVRPEFINRIDEIVIFNALDQSLMVDIVDIQLNDLARRLRSQNLEITVSDAVKEYLAEIGYDPSFGARPLRRAIQRYLENPLAEVLLDGGEFDQLSIDINADVAIQITTTKEIQH